MKDQYYSYTHWTPESFSPRLPLGTLHFLTDQSRDFHPIFNFLIYFSGIKSPHYQLNLKEGPLVISLIFVAPQASIILSIAEYFLLHNTKFCHSFDENTPPPKKKKKKIIIMMKSTALTCHQHCWSSADIYMYGIK